ncbi:hypothetical protein Tco_0240274, partial [Tanacetum coccineum]
NSDVEYLVKLVGSAVGPFRYELETLQYLKWWMWSTGQGGSLDVVVCPLVARCPQSSCSLIFVPYSLVEPFETVVGTCYVEDDQEDNQVVCSTLL